VSAKVYTFRFSVEKGLSERERKELREELEESVLFGAVALNRSDQHGRIGFDPQGLQEDDGLEFASGEEPSIAAPWFEVKEVVIGRCVCAVLRVDEGHDEGCPVRREAESEAEAEGK